MFIPPMLPSETVKPFDDNKFIFEPLIDGHRLQLSLEGGKVRLFTRYGNEVTRKYPELHTVPIRIPGDLVLDGEVACLSPITGKPDFDLLQQRFRMNHVPQIRDAKKEMPVIYYPFDLLQWNGEDWRGRPLFERKEVLHSLLEDNYYFKKMGFVEREGIHLFHLAEQLGLKGIAGKRKTSRYREGRGDGWFKIEIQ
ncbi:hypothetical protein ACFQZE_01195 [Paenibacillus sp. GCM10027627]|uniref:ATP-dependent DNA ligase n=1 Tax=unclassified Paenibacillus TaxID=185978 RepID=UPI00363CCF28